jgi:hypothetical protein
MPDVVHTPQRTGRGTLLGGYYIQICAEQSASYIQMQVNDKRDY